jgi:hypothetical protein
MKKLKLEEKQNNSESVDIKHNRRKIEKQFPYFLRRTVSEHISIISHKYAILAYLSAQDTLQCDFVFPVIDLIFYTN